MKLIPEDGIQVRNFVPTRPDELKSGSFFRRGDILLAKITPSFENGKQAIADNIPIEFGYATTEVYPLSPRLDKVDRMYLFHYLKKTDVRSTIAGKMEGTTGRQRIPKTVIETQLVPLPALAEQRRIAHVLNTIQAAIAAQDDLIEAARQLKRSLMHRLFTYGPGRTPAPTRATKIDEIPEHWSVRPIRETGQVVTGTTPRTSVPEYYGGGFPLISPGDIGEGKYLTHIAKNLSTSGLAVSRQLPLNSVLVVCIGATIGKTAMTSVPRSATNQQINAIIPHSKVNPDFLYYACTYRAPYLPDLAGRAAIPIVNKSNFAEFCVPFAPRSDQAQVARLLSAADRKIAAEQDREAALQTLFNSMLHQLMTGRVRLVSDWG